MLDWNCLADIRCGVARIDQASASVGLFALSRPLLVCGALNTFGTWAGRVPQEFREISAGLDHEGATARLTVDAAYLYVTAFRLGAHLCLVDSQPPSNVSDGLSECSRVRYLPARIDDRIDRLV